MTTVLALCFILQTLIAHWNAQGSFMNDFEVPGTFMELGTEALKRSYTVGCFLKIL